MFEQNNVGVRLQNPVAIYADTMKCSSSAVGDLLKTTEAIVGAISEGKCTSANTRIFVLMPSVQRAGRMWRKKKMLMRGLAALTVSAIAWVAGSALEVPMRSRRASMNWGARRTARAGRCER